MKISNRTPPKRRRKFQTRPPRATARRTSPRSRCTPTRKGARCLSAGRVSGRAKPTIASSRAMAPWPAGEKTTSDSATRLRGHSPPSAWVQITPAASGSTEGWFVGVPMVTMPAARLQAPSRPWRRDITTTARFGRTVPWPVGDSTPAMSLPMRLRERSWPSPRSTTIIAPSGPTAR